MRRGLCATASVSRPRSEGALTLSGNALFLLAALGEQWKIPSRHGGSGSGYAKRSGPMPWPEGQRTPCDSQDLVEVVAEMAIRLEWLVSATGRAAGGVRE